MIKHDYGVTHTFDHCRSHWDYNDVSRHGLVMALYVPNAGLTWVWPWLSADYVDGVGFIPGGATSCEDVQ